MKFSTIAVFAAVLGSANGFAINKPTAMARGISVSGKLFLFVVRTHVGFYGRRSITFSVDSNLDENEKKVMNENEEESCLDRFAFNEHSGLIQSLMELVIMCADDWT